MGRRAVVILLVVAGAAAISAFGFFWMTQVIPQAQQLIEFSL